MHHLVDLVNSAPDQVQAHCLHNQHLYSFFWDLAVLTKTGKFQTAVVFPTAEHQLQEGDDAHFLLQVLQFLHNDWEPADELLVLVNSLLKFLNQSSSESLQ